MLVGGGGVGLSNEPPPANKRLKMARLGADAFGGRYVSVKPEKDCLVVNLGDTFAKLTGGRLKATKHRVLDIGVDLVTSIDVDER